MKLLAPLASLLFFVSCSGLSTNFDYDVEADFSNLSSYAWLEGGEAAGLSDLDRKRAKAAVDDGLQAAGYELVESNPDFEVAVHFTTEEKTRVREYGTAYGYRSVGLSARSFDVDEYQVGTFMLDFVDPAKKELMWRGAASGTVRESPSPEERTKRIREAVAALLENFPPGSDS